jgi:hypothetical protein
MKANISRRNFLQLSGAVAGSAILAGCGGGASDAGSDEPTTDLSDAGIFKVGGIGPNGMVAVCIGFVVLLAVSLTHLPKKGA